MPRHDSSFLMLVNMVCAIIILLFISATFVSSRKHNLLSKIHVTWPCGKVIFTFSTVGVYGGYVGLAAMKHAEVAMSQHC